MLLYSLLYLQGFEDMTIEDIKQFARSAPRRQATREYGHAEGIATTTGPLGQGIANFRRHGIAERKLRDEFGAPTCRTYYTMFCAATAASWKASARKRFRSPAT